MDEPLEYAPASNGRVTLGEVNRNVLALRSDFKEYLEKHEKEHGAVDEKVGAIQRWQATWNGRAIGLATIGSAIFGLLLAHVVGFGV